jgi:hypothetical protein
MNIEAKLKHLEFIQNTITRMANNSFLLKGWCITVVGAIIGLNKDGVDWKVTMLAIFLTIMFWVLDGYFLSQERYFRKRCDEVRQKNRTQIDFKMQLEGSVTSDLDWFTAMMSKTLAIYYITIIVALFCFSLLM